MAISLWLVGTSLYCFGSLGDILVSCDTDGVEIKGEFHVFAEPRMFMVCSDASIHLPQSDIGLLLFNVGKLLLLLLVKLVADKNLKLFLISSLFYFMIACDWIIIKLIGSFLGLEGNGEIIGFQTASLFLLKVIVNHFLFFVCCLLLADII